MTLLAYQFEQELWKDLFHAEVEWKSSEHSTREILLQDNLDSDSDEDEDYILRKMSQPTRVIK